MKELDSSPFESPRSGRLVGKIYQCGGKEDMPSLCPHRVLKTILFFRASASNISSFFPNEGFSSHCQGSINWPRKRIVSGGRRITPVENRDLRSKEASELPLTTRH